MEISENMARIDKEAIGENIGEIVVYQPDEITRLEVKVNEDTVWLTQTQIAQLFGVGQPAISKHLKNIFASGELDITAVHSILEYTAADGKSYKTGFYNLDAILSIGYRVNSRQATRFRQWANTVLKEYFIRGLSFNARLLQLSSDIDKHNAQYPPITVRTFSKAHDRFLIIDQTVYLIGASIKDLGKKWFGFTLLENTDAEELLGRM